MCTQEKEEQRVQHEARKATEAKREIVRHLNQTRNRMKEVQEEMIYLQAKEKAGKQLWDEKMLKH